MNHNPLSSGHSQPGVSVIICCYNSAGLIEDTLRHLSEQKVNPFIPWEILVVDNNSRDNTLEVVQRFWSTVQCSGVLHTHSQTTPGKTSALMMGFNRARYDYCIICDHDNWLASDYIQKAYTCMMSSNTIGAVGGRGIPVIEAEPAPPWFEEFAKCYAVGAQVIDHLPVEGHVQYGAGLVLRKQPILRLFGPDFELQLADRIPRKGNNILGGGDYEFCYLLSLMNLRVEYSDELTFRHFLTKDRFSIEYLKKLYRGYGIVRPFLTPYTELLQAKRTGRDASHYFWIRDCWNTITTLAAAAVGIHANKEGYSQMMIDLNNLSHRYALITYFTRHFYLSILLSQLKKRFG